MKLVGEAAHFCCYALHFPGKLWNIRVLPFRSSRNGPARSRQFHAENRQRLPNVVVQLSRNSRAFRLLSIQEAAGEFLACLFGVLLVADVDAPADVAGERTIRSLPGEALGADPPEFAIPAP